MPLTIQSESAAMPPASAVDQPRAFFARRLLLEAAFLGGLADALLRNGFGIGLGIWMATFAVLLVRLVPRRGSSMRPEQIAWLSAAVLLAASFGWRDSQSLRAYDFLAMLGALAVLGATLAPGSLTPTILGQRLRDLAQSLGSIVKQVIGGVISLTFGDSALGDLLRSWRGTRGSALIRSTIIALPLLLLFGLLFGAADPVFEKLLALPQLDWGELMSHVVVAGFFAWVVGGWMRGALLSTGPRTRVLDNTAITLGTVEVTVVLGGLVALFALFVGVQVGWLFGGERLVRSTTGLSYAQYARHGFFELVWVSLLVLPVLLGVHATIPRDDERTLRRHRQLSLALIALLGGVMASALGRMALYVHYYGLSSDRLFASVFMAWLAIVFVWLAFTVLRGRAHDFAAGMSMTGFLTLAALNVANPDALVARVNVGRAGSAVAVSDSLGSARPTSAPDSPIDYAYLTKDLNGDAVEIVVSALLDPPVAPTGTLERGAEVRSRCLAVQELLREWAAPAPRNRELSDWRLWNVGAWHAERAVRAHEAELRRVTCLDATGESPFGDRERRPSRAGEQWYTAPSSKGLSVTGGTQ